MTNLKRDKPSKYCRLTDKDKEYIRKHFGRGKMSTRQIAKHIKCDEHSVAYWAKQMNIERGDLRLISSDNDQYLRDNIRTMPMKDIAKHYGCHYMTISRYVKEHHLKDAPLPDTITLEGTTYRRVTDTLHVSRDGRVLHNGKPHKTTITNDVRGRKTTAHVNIMLGGKVQYYQLSRLVAKAWCYGYTDECYILYKDEDIHNVHSDNLIIATEKQYIAFLQRNSGYTGTDINERKDKLNHVIEEANITLHYLKTADITPLNKYVERRLYPLLMAWCRDKLYYGTDTIMQIVPDCIARLYEIILNGACIYNYERFCKQMIMNYKRTGTYGHIADVPKPIQIIVEQLNTDCLWSKYKVTKLK